MQRIDVYWRDIPSQVLIKRGRERGKYLLSHRFQAAIDRAAMRAGKGGSDAYLEEWRRVTSSIESDSSPHVLAEELGRAIEQQFSDDDLARLVAAKGFDETD
ncbi:MAG: hypothetical protein CNF01_06890 [Halieaceae bacterium MED-G27]|jgi:hypothetical protein|nr:MAG: hypothetical protein CNF01_06890 [Halieaceae bacterium MED-G27]|tara:strand:- start:5045 stop:5350 length:306 start_codon:yes stop_codon:yes gene_type:complete